MSNYDTSALAIALAALGKNGSGGGSGSGTVSVIVAGTETIEPGNPAQVLNLGDQENVELYFYIPAGENGAPGTPGAPGTNGKDGSKFYTSNEEPGTSIAGMVNGDYCLYSNGEIYQLVDGVLTNTNVNISGSQIIVIDSEPTGIIPEGSKEGDIVIYNDMSIYKVVDNQLVNTGVSINVFSPSIEVKEETEDTYILTITNEDGSFDTPNLKATSSSTSFDMYGYAQSIGYEGTEDEFKEAFLRVLNFFTKKDTVVDGNADPSKDPTLDGGDSDEEVGVDTGEATLTFDNRLEDSTPGV